MYTVSTPQVCLSQFLADIQFFKKILDAGFEAYLIKAKGKPNPFGVSLHEYCKWINPKARVRTSPSDTSVLISGHLHYFWQFSKANMKFEGQLLEHMVNSELPESLPEQILQRLPYWSQWLSLPIQSVSHNQKFRVDFDDAFVGYTRIGNVPHLCICAPFDPEDQTLRSNQFSPSVTTYLPLDKPVNPLDIIRNMHLLNLVDTSDKPQEERADLLFTMHHFLTKILAAIMFVCSQQDNLFQGGHQQAKPKRLGKSYKLDQVVSDRVIVVGHEMLQVIKEFEDDVEKCTRAFNGRRPHIRKAHYHHFWTGPKTGPRKLICKWLPPSVVRGTAAGDESSDKG